MPSSSAIPFHFSSVHFPPTPPSTTSPPPTVFLPQTAASARCTFPYLTYFRLARFRGFRRLFAHATTVLFKLHIAKPETKEISSLSVEPCDCETLKLTVFEVQESEVFTEMGFIFFFFFFFLLTIGSTFAANPAPDYTSLVYRGCSKQPLSDPTGSYSKSISNLYTLLVQQSAKSKFYKSTSGSVTGLFQCRGDLSSGACYDCVSRIPPMADQLCAGKVAAARVQLQGCYLLYEVSGFTQISGMEMLFKLCSRASGSGTQYDINRDTALSEMETGIATAVGGFYATTYQKIYAMGQCEGDLSSVDCGTCIKAAAQRAQVECGNSLAGQTYLHKCFISYSYGSSSASSSSSYSPYSSSSSSYSSSSSGTGQTTKTVAIILGGTAGVGFLIICVLFARGLSKKDDDY